MNIGKRVIVHRLLEVNGVENLNAVWFAYDLSFFIPDRFSVFPDFRSTAGKQLSTFHKDSSFRICHNIAAVKLH